MKALAILMPPDSKPDVPNAAKIGDRVKVHYTCMLEDGSLFASTREKEPKEFVLGSADVILGLQDAVIGMKPGETKTVNVPPEKAYGPYHEEMTATLDRRMVPDHIALEIGAALRVKHADDHESDAFVTEISERTIKVDGNHPLAGKRLIMDVELVDLEAD